MTTASTLCDPTSAPLPISQALMAKRYAVPSCSRSSTVCFPAPAACRLCTVDSPASWKLYCASLPCQAAIHQRQCSSAALWSAAGKEQACSPAAGVCPAHATAVALCCAPSADCCCVLPQELYPVTSKTAGTSNYTTPLNHVGVYYFVCQEDNHCIQGQVSSALSSLDQSQLIQNTASVVKADSVLKCAAQAFLHHSPCSCVLRA